MTVNEFPDDLRLEWIAADIETSTYINGVMVSEDELKALGKDHPVGWFRERTTVKPYAWLVSDGRRFAWLDTFDEFASFCASHRVGAVWFYNARFDFAVIDYQMISTGWKEVESGRVTDRTYKSLHSDFGQRYSLRLGYNHKTKDGHVRCHGWTMYDFCNIFHGGLDKILQDFDVKDFDGKPIRKLTMNYQSEADTEDRVAYMRNDADGLYHAIRIADEFLADNVGYRIAGKKPDIMTAGGLAKKVLLRSLYGYDDKRNKKVFQFVHKIGLWQDVFYRRHNLYRGGITYLNKRYAEKLLPTPIHRYDINSMYPKQMHAMPDIVGYPERISFDEYAKTRSDDHVYILEIESLHGHVREKMIPLYYDVHDKEYTEIMYYEAEEDEVGTLYMFDFELEELRNYYDFTVNCSGVLRFRAERPEGYRTFVDTYYKMKADAKREKNKVKEAFAKLLLNSSYGKLAENPLRQGSHREINPETGAVHLVLDKTKGDSSACLSVVQGAYITASARRDLMEYIRKVCKGDPEKNFVYCDTDSIHSFCAYDDCDPYQLGALKDESVVDGVCVPFDFCKYIAPKTYFDGRKNGDQISEIEVHSKGVSTEVVSDELRSGDGFKTFREIDEIFRPGVKFQPLSALNVPGGKALIPIAKYLAKPHDSELSDDAGNEVIFESEVEEECQNQKSRA